MTAVLVTGGSGFFGKSILESFASGGLEKFGVADLIVLARSASGLRSECPELLSDRVRLVDEDVRALSSLHGADVVVHAAASSNAARYESDARSECDIIIEGTRRVSQLVSRSARKPKLLHVSSGAVYGQQPPHVARLAEYHPLANSMEPAKAAYASAKREAEAIVRSAADINASPTAVARCFAFVGPWLPLDQHFAIGDFIGRGLSGAVIRVKARHSVYRSYLYADDLVDWLFRIALAANEHCPIYNVGSDEEIAIHDLAQLVAELACVPVDLPEPRFMDAARVDRYVPDVDLVKRQLGVRIHVPLKQAIQQSMAKIRARWACGAGNQ